MNNGTCARSFLKRRWLLSPRTSSSAPIHRAASLRCTAPSSLTPRPRREMYSAPGAGAVYTTGTAPQSRLALTRCVAPLALVPWQSLSGCGLPLALAVCARLVLKPQTWHVPAVLAPQTQQTRDRCVPCHLLLCSSQHQLKDGDAAPSPLLKTAAVKGK